MSLGLRLKARLLLLMCSFRAGAKGLDGLVLRAVYGSDVMERLMRIHRHPDRDGPDGILTVILCGRRPAYVECRYTDNGNAIVCEAIAGKYPQMPDATIFLTTAAIEDGLKNAGYWRDADGHARFRYAITRDSGIWCGASAVILAPLIDVFGARAGSEIEIIAPLAPERDEVAIQRELRRR